MKIQKGEDEDSRKMMNVFIIFPDFFYFQQKYILKSKFIRCGSHINIFSIKNKKKDLNVCFIRDKGPKCYKEKINDQNVTKKYDKGPTV
jgi:hypothetical protein